LLKQNPTSLGFRAPPSSRSSTAATRDSSAAPTANQTQDGSVVPLPTTAEEAQRREIENGTHQLETLLRASIDRNFDKFELYVMRYILAVPADSRDWIRLAHYDGLDLPSSLPSSSSPPAARGEEGETRTRRSDEAPTVQSLHALRRRLQASQQLNCMLHAEKARNDVLLSELRAAVGTAKEAASVAAVKPDPDALAPAPAKAPLAFLRDKGDLAAGVGASQQPLATTTAFSLSQLQALRALSTSLRTIMPDLLLATGADDDDDDGAGG